MLIHYQGIQVLTMGSFTIERTRNTQEFRQKVICMTLLAIFISGCDLSPVCIMVLLTT